jgi:DNA-binding beta-propeller fold protein YncE
MKTFLSLLVVTSLIIGVRAQETNAPFKLDKTIPLPNVKGRIDHLAVDIAGWRLFVAALGNNTVEVLDLKTGKPLRSLPDFAEPQGIAYVSECDKLFVANGAHGICSTLDGHSFKSIGSVELGDDADNVRYDEIAKTVYVGYGNGALGVLDVKTGQPISDILLAGHPESFRLEAAGRRIFVNVPRARLIAVIDRETKSVVATWPMEKFQANFPMALDEANHRLFVGCRNPARLVVFDTGTGKPVADLEISGDADDMFFDVKRQRLYLSCGEGFLDVIQRHAGDHYERIARQPARDGARTCFYSPDFDRLYLAVPQRNGQAAEIRIYQPR